MPGINVCIFVSIAFLVAVKNYLIEDFKKEGVVLAHNLRGQSSWCLGQHGKVHRGQECTALTLLLVDRVAEKDWGGN